MFVRQLLRALLLVCGILVCQTALAADWIGKKIMPKSDAVPLRVDGGYSGSVFSIQWPAVVKTVDGNWLWVEDDGGARPAAGWVRSDDVFLFNSALNHFNNHLVMGSQAGGQYWLRAICWESAKEFDLATKDYQSALRQHPMNSDARIGLARTTAKTTYNDKLFVDAWQMNRSLPRFFIDWGQALEADGQFARARAMYEEAIRLNPNWRMPHYAMGTLLAAQGQHDEALANFDEAIRRDATFHLAFRERASSCLTCQKKKDAKAAALTSARKACELCYFRDAESLAVLAKILAAFEQWPDASRYQQMAVEYAPLSAKPKHKEQFFEYWKKSGGGTQLASNDTAKHPNGEVNKGFDPEDTSEDLPHPSAGKLKPPPAFIDRSSRSFE